MKVVFAIFLCTATVLFTVMFSPYGATISFHILDYIFPAISGEIINTSTRHGLSVPSYNLAFLPFALLAGSFFSLAIFYRGKTRAALFICGIAALLLSMTSASMFWPGEQLINLKAFSLLAFWLMLISMLVLILLVNHPLGNHAKIAIFLFTMIGYWGLTLPITHFIAAILMLLAFDQYDLLPIWLVYGLAPVIAIVLAIRFANCRTKKINLGQ
jgi:hypothetical protein